MGERTSSSWGYLLVALATFLAFQALVVVLHEFTHSTVAWLLGHMRSPLDIVWGNPLTLRGWDEGVAYRRLVADGHLLAEALIGGSPLVMHAAVAFPGLMLMRGGRPRNRWLFHALFWFVIAHLMELIAYIVMRPFATNGDTGHLNHGLGLSPWILFIAGSAALLWGLCLLFGEILPRLCDLFARQSVWLRWAILTITAFLLFLWGSGLRVITALYPGDPQWRLGLTGVVAFAAVLVLYRPTRPGGRVLTERRRP